MSLVSFNSFNILYFAYFSFLFSFEKKKINPIRGDQLLIIKRMNIYYAGRLALVVAILGDTKERVVMSCYLLEPLYLYFVERDVTPSADFRYPCLFVFFSAFS